MSVKQIKHCKPERLNEYGKKIKLSNPNENESDQLKQEVINYIIHVTEKKFLSTRQWEHETEGTMPLTFRLLSACVLSPLPSVTLGFFWLGKKNENMYLNNICTGSTM